MLARPRVRCCSSRVTLKLGHMVPASNFLQWPLLLHISTALANPSVGSSPVPGGLSSTVPSTRPPVRSAAAASWWRGIDGSLRTFQADQSRLGLKVRGGVAAGAIRKSDSSSIFDPRTILPGLSSPEGSKASLTASNARVRSGPNCHPTHSVRTSPSPCSPLKAPLNRRTNALASSAIPRIFTLSPRRRLRMGRTCKVPTEAWAYQVPCVP